MISRALKRSRTLTLVAIASVSLVACGDDDSTEMRRAFYPTLQECLREWTPQGGLNAASVCEPANGGYYGPYFEYDDRDRSAYFFSYGGGYVPSSSRYKASYLSSQFSSDGMFRSRVPSAKVASYTIRGGFGGRAGRSSGYASSRSFGG